MIVQRADWGTSHPFTRISNAALRDERLSLKARGLLAQILSMSETWGLSVSGMLSLQRKDGKDSVRAAWRELEAAGYLRKRDRCRDGRGRLLSVEYEVCECPNERDGPQRAGLPHVGKPRVAEPRVGNPSLRTTDAKNEQGCSTTKRKELEGSMSAIIEIRNKTEQEAGTVPSALPSVEASGDARDAGSLGDAGALAGHTFLECREAVDAAIAKNVEMVKVRYWFSLDERVRGHAPFTDRFGTSPGVAWTADETGYLNEIAGFCRKRWPDAAPAESVAGIVRGAFRRGVKAHQVLRYWVEHCGCRVSLRPYLTLAGGGKVPAKRHDFLLEVAAAMGETEDVAVPLEGNRIGVTAPAGEPLQSRQDAAASVQQPPEAGSAYAPAASAAVSETSVAVPEPFDQQAFVAKLRAPIEAKSARPANPVPVTGRAGTGATVEIPASAS